MEESSKDKEKELKEQIEELRHDNERQQKLIGQVYSVHIYLYINTYIATEVHV